MDYGQTRCLWNLISGTGIFFIGFGITTYHGVSSLFGDHHFWGCFICGMMCRFKDNNFEHD
jgi:hypothetical protein